MNVRKRVAAAPCLFSVAQNSKSAVPRVSKPDGRNFPKPTWKSARRQVDSALTESKLIKAGQTKMNKYILCVWSRDFRAGTLPIPFQSGLDPS